MTYRQMIEAARTSGKASEAAMWASIQMVDEMMEELREKDPEKFWCLMRRTHRALYGPHYDEQFATYDIGQMHSTDAQGRTTAGAHWTREQVAQAWQGKTFPAGTTDCDKWVAANAVWHDMHKHFDDSQVLQIAFLFFFADEDYQGEGKVWEYLNR